MRIVNIIVFLVMVLACSSCNTKGKKPPVDLSGLNSVTDISIPYTELNGVKPFQ